jgi:ribose transport system substrate-binding protein
MQNLGKWAGVVVGVLSVAVMFASAGCSKEQKGPKGTKENPWVVGMSQCNEGEPWRAQMDADLKDAAAKHDNLKLVVKDAQNNVTTQQDQVREFITQKVDLLIISPKEATPLTPPVSEAMKAGIPVVVLDRAIDGDNYTCFIGGDNKVIGKAVGQYVAKVLNGKGKVVELMGLQTSVPGKDRHDGFIEGLGDSLGDGKIEIIYHADDEWLENKARDDMKSALSKYPEIDLVYGHNDPMAHGAWIAARDDNNRAAKIKFVGIDSLPSEGQQYVKQSILTATFYYPTLGPEAIDTALKVLHGEKVEKITKLPTKIFTKENVEKGGEVVKP